MSDWLRCRKCETPLIPPWELKTKETIYGLIKGVPCPKCGHIHDYPIDYLAERLAEIIESK